MTVKLLTKILVMAVQNSTLDAKKDIQIII